MFVHKITTNIALMITRQDILDVALQLDMPITDKQINYVLENYSETGEIWNAQVEDLLYQCEPRVCDITGEIMTEGWLADDSVYLKYEKDALAWCIENGYESIDDAFECDAIYWTEWED